MRRLIDRKIKLRDLLLHRNEERYTFLSYSGLKTPEEYASYKILTMNRKWLRETAYTFISLTIPTCITTCPKECDKQGILLFKTIQGYMKDRKWAWTWRVMLRYNMEGSQLAYEIIILLQNPNTPTALRTEAYCQLIKQLTQNPSTQSVSLVRAWGFLHT